MNWRFFTCSVLLAAAMTTIGCASPSQIGTTKAATRPNVPADGKAMVVVYRNHAEPTMWNAALDVGGKKVASLGQKTYTWFMAQPGQTSIRAAWPALSGQRDASIVLELTAGQIHYVELTGISRLDGISGAGNLRFKMGAGMAEQSPDAGNAAIANCCAPVSPAMDP